MYFPKKKQKETPGYPSEFPLFLFTVPLLVHNDIYFQQLYAPMQIFFPVVSLILFSPDTGFSGRAYR